MQSTIGGQPRLHARPGALVRPGAPAPLTGVQPLFPGAARDNYLYVPPGCDPARPLPLVLLLHGAGGHAHDGLDLLRRHAASAGLLLVAPAAREHTWDVIASRAYGPDLNLVDKALAHVFARFAVDPARIAIGGFSDGASYALSLGLANGDLFTHVMAFSPGFIGPHTAHGAPGVFVSHGERDKVLPISLCSGRIVAWLREAGYALTYKQFDGGHAIPAPVAALALDWFLGQAGEV